LKTRLLGAVVLIALAVLFVPMFFSSKPPAVDGDQSVSLAIPPAPEGDLQTKTMSLSPDAAPGAPGVPASAASATSVVAGTGDRLATVNIGSQRPRDVETDPEAGKPPVPTTVTRGTDTSPSEPVIPMQSKAPAGAPLAKATPPASTSPAKAPTAVAAAPRPAAPVISTGASATSAAADEDSYMLNLSAYASASGASSLERKVRGLGYPVSAHATTQAGQPRTLVMAGPFGSRTAAEAARLKITQSIPGVPARLERGAGHQGAAPSTASKGTASAAASTSRAGGWAVQLAAMSGRTDAIALRDKLRANGFDGFVDSVQSSGKTLWRVRAGPQTQRADAQRLHDQIKARLGIDGNVVSVP
jgi:cell division septation protein DedD